MALRQFDVAVFPAVGHKPEALVERHDVLADVGHDRELIALGVAVTTQCPYCIEAHVKAAKKAGASREEITESSFIAAALRAGGAATHGAMALKFYDQV